MRIARAGREGRLAEVLEVRRSRGQGFDLVGSASRAFRGMDGGGGGEGEGPGVATFAAQSGGLFGALRRFMGGSMEAGVRGGGCDGCLSDGTALSECYMIED